MIGANYADQLRGKAYVFSFGLTNGDSCAGDGECASGHCVDDVCCDARLLRGLRRLRGRPRAPPLTGPARSFTPGSKVAPRAAPSPATARAPIVGLATRTTTARTRGIAPRTDPANCEGTSAKDATTRREAACRSPVSGGRVHERTLRGWDLLRSGLRGERALPGGPQSLWRRRHLWARKSVRARRDVQVRRSMLDRPLLRWRLSRHHVRHYLQCRLRAWCPVHRDRRVREPIRGERFRRRRRLRVPHRPIGWAFFQLRARRGCEPAAPAPQAKSSSLLPYGHTVALSDILSRRKVVAFVPSFSARMSMTSDFPAASDEIAIW